MKYTHTLYSGDFIEIDVVNRTIDYITVYIPSYWKTEDILKIYDTLTGYKPNIEDKDIEDIMESDLDPLYSYSILDELEDYYPYVKTIRANGFSWYSIYVVSTDLEFKNNTIIITVNYVDSFLKAPGASERYSGMISDRAKISGITLQNKINKYFKNGMKLAQETINEIYGDPVYLKEFYGKYVATRHSTENDSKEKATIKARKETMVNAPDDYTRQGRDIKIHASYGIIDEIKLRISLVAHSGICNNVDTLQIYDIMTGYSPSTQFVPEEKLIKIDKDKYIKKIQSYKLLDELKKYYPCLEGIHRNKLYDDQLYPTNVDVCCEDNAVKITVKYGFAVPCGSLDRPKLLELYSSIRSEHSKLFDHLCLIPDNSNEKLKELKEKINSVFGVPTFEAFDKITDELKDTYIKKNHDYGNSFDKSIDKFGLTAAVVRMNDKMERLSSLLNKDAKVDESIRDTVMDLANYCIMTAMYLDNKKENK